MSKFLKFTESLLSFCIVLIPFALISGSLISDLTIVLINIFFIAYCFLKKDFKIFKNVYFKYFLFFYFICILGSSVSEYKFDSLIRSLAYIRFGVFTLAFWVILSIDKNLLKKLFFSILFCFVILILDGTFQYFFGKNIFGYSSLYDYRISSFFGDELIYGSYLSRFWPILLGLFFVNQNLYSNKLFINFFWLIIFLSIVLIFLSGERAAFFNILFALFFLMIMLKENSRKFILLSIVSFFFIGIIINSNDSYKYRMLNLTKQQLGISEGNIRVFSKVHEGHYLAAIDIFKSNKIIGVGVKNFRNYCYKNEKYSKEPFRCTSHPHNIYVQLLVETGIIGFFCIFFIFLLLVYFSFKHFYFKFFKKKILFNDLQISILAAILINLWPLIPSGSFFNNYISIIYFFPLGILLWSKKKIKF